MLVFGTIWTLSNIFEGLPVDGGAPSLVEIPDLTGSEQAQALNDLQELGFFVHQSILDFQLFQGGL